MFTSCATGVDFQPLKWHIHYTMYIPVLFLPTYIRVCRVETSFESTELASD